MLVKLTPASEVREPPKMPHACGAVTESGRPMGRMAVGAGCPDRTAQHAMSEQRCVPRAVLEGAYAAELCGASFGAREH